MLGLRKGAQPRCSWDCEEQERDSDEGEGGGGSGCFGEENGGWVPGKSGRVGEGLWWGVVGGKGRERRRGEEGGGGRQGGEVGVGGRKVEGKAEERRGVCRLHAPAPLRVKIERERQSSRNT